MIFLCSQVNETWALLQFYKVQCKWTLCRNIISSPLSECFFHLIRHLFRKQLVEGEARATPTKARISEVPAQLFKASPFMPYLPTAYIRANSWIIFIKLVVGRDLVLNKRPHNLPLFCVSEGWGRKINLQIFFRIWGQVAQNAPIQDSR